MIRMVILYGIRSMIQEKMMKLMEWQWMMLEMRMLQVLHIIMCLTGIFSQ